MPDDLRFSKDHEWVRIAEDGHAVIGVTAFAAGQLGDVVYVDLPAVGDGITAGEGMGEIESTKSVSDLFSPLTGTVLSVNDAVVDGPELVNQDPYGEGWLLTASVDTLPDDLMGAEEYERLTAS